MTQPVRNILRDLDNIRENLLAFSDDVWLAIDHNDTAALEAGVVFKKKLNTQLDAFGSLSTEIARLVQEYTKVQTEGEASTAIEIGSTPAENTRIIKDLDRNDKHTLTEDFTYKRPCGFVLEGTGYKDVSTWSRVYELVMRHLAARAPAVFKSLADHPATVTKRGNRRFTAKRDELRKPLALPHGLYAETNLSANDLCESIRTLLPLFSVSLDACTLYLRQDRDA